MRCEICKCEIPECDTLRLGTFSADPVRFGKSCEKCYRTIVIPTKASKMVNAILPLCHIVSDTKGKRTPQLEAQLYVARECEAIRDHIAMLLPTLRRNASLSTPTHDTDLEHIPFDSDRVDEENDVYGADTKNYDEPWKLQGIKGNPKSDYEHLRNVDGQRIGITLKKNYYQSLMETERE